MSEKNYKYAVRVCVDEKKYFFSEMYIAHHGYCSSIMESMWFPDERTAKDFVKLNTDFTEYYLCEISFFVDEAKNLGKEIVVR